MDEYVAQCKDCPYDCKQLAGTVIDWCPAMADEQNEGGEDD